tara:strand:- start:784 stop:1212 length:429 start_codon:yes stop_codon:yes gene_type:complete
MSLQGNKKNKRGQSSAMLREKKKKEKEKEYLSKFSPEYHKEMEDRQKRDDRKRRREERRAKKLTPAQKRFKEREAKGLSGLTGGPKGETLAQSRARRKKAMQDAARERNKKFKEKRKNKNKLQENTKPKKRFNTSKYGSLSL